MASQPVEHAGRRSAPARATPGVAGLALGAVLAPIFFVASLVRGERCVHPDGAAYDATVVVADPASRLAYGCILGQPGAHHGLVRLSRGLGYQPPRPDVHGLALRLDAGPRRPQDVLLITAHERPDGRHSITTTPGFGPMLSSVLAMRLGVAVGRLTATPLGEQPSDDVVLGGGGEGMSFSLHGQLRGGPAVDLAVLHVGPPRSPAEAEALRFDVWNTGGGIVPVGVLEGARRVVYPASQLGRKLRGA